MRRAAPDSRVPGTDDPAPAGAQPGRSPRASSGSAPTSRNRHHLRRIDTSSTELTPPRQYRRHSGPGIDTTSVELTPLPSGWRRGRLLADSAPPATGRAGAPEHATRLRLPGLHRGRELRTLDGFGATSRNRHHLIGLGAHSAVRAPVRPNGHHLGRIDTTSRQNRRSSGIDTTSSESTPPPRSRRQPDRNCHHLGYRHHLPAEFGGFATVEPECR